MLVSGAVVELRLGCFGPFPWPLAMSPMRLYAACIHKPFEDFHRLECGVFEKRDVVTPYISYLHESFSMKDWCDVSSNVWTGRGASRSVYFTTHQDAMLFYMRWAG